MCDIERWFAAFTFDRVWHLALNEKTIEKYLKEDLQHIEKYYDTNDLIINLQKGKAETIFGTGNRLSTINKRLDVPYKGQIINNVSASISTLGIM